MKKYIDVGKALAYVKENMSSNEYLATAMCGVIQGLPTVEMPEIKEPCEFCAKFDFSSAKAESNKYGAHIHLALASTHFERSEQFNYCPVCGRYVGANEKSV